MVDFGKAFQRPFLDGKSLLLGIILSIIPVINLFARGYILEATGLTKRKLAFDKLPKWDNWGILFVRGIIALVITVIYHIPAAIVFLVGAAAAAGTVLTALFASGGIAEIMKMTSADAILAQLLSNGAIITSLLALGPVLTIAAILGVLARYLVPMAILNYLANDSFGSSFAFGKICQKAFTGQYFMVWLVSIFTGIVGVMVLGFIPLVGHGMAAYLVGMITFTLFGMAYKEIR
jgi:hypothetical protein